MVGLEEEIIDKDFRQSYWLALQFWVQPNRIFTVGVPQASHGKRTDNHISFKKPDKQQTFEKRDRVKDDNLDLVVIL